MELRAYKQAFSKLGRAGLAAYPTCRLMGVQSAENLV